MKREKTENPGRSLFGKRFHPHIHRNMEYNLVPVDLRIPLEASVHHRPNAKRPSSCWEDFFFFFIVLISTEETVRGKRDWGELWNLCLMFLFFFPPPFLCLVYRSFHSNKKEMEIHQAAEPRFHSPLLHRVFTLMHGQPEELIYHFFFRCQSSNPWADTAVIPLPPNTSY